MNLFYHLPVFALSLFTARAMEETPRIVFTDILDGVQSFQQRVTPLSRSSPSSLSPFTMPWKISRLGLRLMGSVLSLLVSWLLLSRSSMRVFLPALRPSSSTTSLSTLTLSSVPATLLAVPSSATPSSKTTLPSPSAFSRPSSTSTSSFPDPNLGRGRRIRTASSNPARRSLSASSPQPNS